MRCNYSEVKHETVWQYTKNGKPALENVWEKSMGHTQTRSNSMWDIKGGTVYMRDCLWSGAM